MKKHYDMLVLVFALLALLGSAGYLIVRIGVEQNQLHSGQELREPDDYARVEPVDEKPYAPTVRLLISPFQSDPGDRTLLVSELRVRSVNQKALPAPIPFDAQICPFTGAEQPSMTDYDTDLDGMSDEYEETYGLNPRNSSDVWLDLDGDGFSNLEEFQAGTDPSDPLKFPSLLAKLRMMGSKAQPFTMRFQGVQELPNGEVKYQLNMRTLSQTYFAKMGDVVDDYKLVAFEEDITQDGIRKVDRSRLILEKDGKQEVLIKGEARSKSEHLVALVSLLDGTRLTARVGETLSYKGQNFKLVELGRDKVRVQDLQTQSSIEVPKLTSEERMDLTGAGEAMGAPILR